MTITTTHDLVKLDIANQINHVSECINSNPLIEARSSNVSIEDIFQTVSIITDVSVDEIKGHSRVRRLVIARQLAMYFIKYFDHEEISLKGIGKLFGNRDHSTVIHSIEGIKRVIQTKEKPYFEWYKEIKTAL